jgi:hypothetical protein
MIYVVSQAVPAEAPLIADMLLALMDEVGESFRSDPTLCRDAGVGSVFRLVGLV